MTILNNTQLEKGCMALSVTCGDSSPKGRAEDALNSVTQYADIRSGAYLYRYAPKLFYRHPPERMGFAYNFTRTGERIAMESSVTAQSMASTCTPAADASRRPAPKAGSVASLGCRYFTSGIWMTNSA